ncbi:MAG: lytic murein transglycosylase B [Pseudomonadota bacterium]
MNPTISGHSRRALAAALLLLSASPLAAIDTTRDDVRAFIDRVAETHQVERQIVADWLAAAELQPRIIAAISKPAERVRPWHEYREIFLTPERIKAGVEFWNEHAATLAAAEEAYGVPAEIIVGIIGVETYYGRIVGSYRVRDALATLAFDYPPRSRFFTAELEAYFLLSRAEGWSVDEVRGSYAGAMGRGQFIPTSYREYAVDFDKDGRRDLFNSWPDAIGSVANYLRRHRWRADKPTLSRASIVKPFTIYPPKKNELKLNSTLGELRSGGVRTTSKAPDAEPATLIRLDGKGRNEYWVGMHNFYVITRYNRSVMYALAVWQLGDAIAAARQRN